MPSPGKNAVIYCESGFNTTNGKTAHGLIRLSERYKIFAVIDSKYAGSDSGMILDGIINNIPIVESLDKSLSLALAQGIAITEFIIGLAPDGGRLPQEAIRAIMKALESGMNVISGLHDFISDNRILVELANKNNCTLIDIRKPPEIEKLHFFSGKIEQVDCLKIALLGTDSAVGKRTTAWLLVHAFRKAGYKAEMIGTGQTAWLQGAKYSIVLDSLINDFVSGEIEHSVYEAWINEKPDVIILEGQGSLMNPAYPGGFELMAAGRPDFIILQHAPERKEYDGFPGYPLHPLDHQIRAIELISGKPVKAITINHEGMLMEEIPEACKKINMETGIPTFDVLANGTDVFIKTLKTELQEWNKSQKRN